MAHLSSQHHSFDINLASVYGVDGAILIHHFQHWIRINSVKGTNFKDGRTWTYQTRGDIQSQFPYWTRDHVRRLCEKLVEEGVLITGNYNKSKIDKTLWYAFKEPEKFLIPPPVSNKDYERQNCPSKGKSAKWKGKSATPIPDTKTNPRSTDKNNNKRKEESASPPLLLSEKELLRKKVGKRLTPEQFEHGWKCFEAVPDKKKVDNPTGWIVKAGKEGWETKPKDWKKENKAFLKKVCDANPKAIKNFSLIPSKDCLEFSDHRFLATKVYLECDDFQEVVKYYLKEMGMNDVLS